MDHLSREGTMLITNSPSPASASDSTILPSATTSDARRPVAANDEVEEGGVLVVAQSEDVNDHIVWCGAASAPRAER